MESGEEEPTMLMMVGRHYAIAGESDEALNYFRRAVRADPSSPVIHSQIGLLLAGRQELEASAAHFFIATLLWEANPAFHQQLARTMTELGLHQEALSSLLAAQRLDSAILALANRITMARAAAGAETHSPAEPRIAVTRHDSGYPHTIYQTRPDTSGRQVNDGIWTEWYDRGRGVKRFRTYSRGVAQRKEMNWDRDGVPAGDNEYAGTSGNPAAGRRLSRSCGAR